MPAIGDQHKAIGQATSNPFDNDKPAPSAYTAAEIATLQSRLDKQLGPEYISSRPGAAGQKVHYLAAEKVINLANEVFGFNGWSSGIQNIQIDFVDENATTGKISLGLSVIVRVTLKDGTFHEDIGYGHIENCKGKAAAFEKAKKEGTTDGLKRALRTFGNVLGNCIYDKDFVAKVTKVKVGAGRWDVNELHRHPDFMPKEVKEELKKIEYEDKTVSLPTSLTTMSSGEDFPDGIDMADFDEADFNMSDPLGHPDEVILPFEPVQSRAGQMKPPEKYGTTTPSRQPQQKTTAEPSAAMRQYPGPGMANLNARAPIQQNHQPDRPHPNTTATREQPHHTSDSNSSSPGQPSSHFAPPPGAAQPPPTNEPVGFYSAKAAAGGPSAASRFNPHAESPSIRKTPGIDHRKSAPVSHDLVKQPGIQAAPRQPNRDFVDPRSNTGRQLGNGQSPQQQPNRPPPGGFGSGGGGGGMTTSAYRPPTRRSDGPGAGGPPQQQQQAQATSNTAAAGNGNMAAGVKRPPLSDLSNNSTNLPPQQQHNVTARTDEGVDAKRQRVVGPPAPPLGDVENVNANANANGGRGGGPVA